MYIFYDASYILMVAPWVRMAVYKDIGWFCLNRILNVKIYFCSYLIYFERVMFSGPIVCSTVKLLTCTAIFCYTHHLLVYSPGVMWLVYIKCRRMQTVWVHSAWSISSSHELACSQIIPINLNTNLGHIITEKHLLWEKVWLFTNIIIWGLFMSFLCS